MALNFSESDQWALAPFARAGSYREELHGQDNPSGLSAGEERWVLVPGNYGRIWTTGA